MASTQFIHVAQFFETIFCFSILVLIGQRFVMMWKKLDQKYLQTKIKQFDEESRWQQKKTFHDPSFRQGQQEHRGEEQYNETKQQQTQNEKTQQPPKQQNLRSSLVENEHDQTDRKIAQNDEYGAKQYKRKSLTDLRNQQQRNSKQIEIKDESDMSQSRKNSMDSNTGAENNKSRQKNQKEKKMASELQRPHFVDLNSQEPSITSNYSHPEGEFREGIKTNFKIQLFTQIDAIFSEHIPILMSILILGILVHSTYLLTMICFFGYIFSHLILKNAGSPQKHSNELTEESFLAKLTIIVPKLWIVAIFITYWADSQFS